MAQVSTPVICSVCGKRLRGTPRFDGYEVRAHTGRPVNSKIAGRPCPGVRRHLGRELPGVLDRDDVADVRGHRRGAGHARRVVSPSTAALALAHRRFVCGPTAGPPDDEDREAAEALAALLAEEGYTITRKREESPR